MCGDHNVHSFGSVSQDFKNSTQSTRMDRGLRFLNDCNRRRGALIQCKQEPQCSKRAIGHAKSIEIEAVLLSPTLAKPECEKLPLTHCPYSADAWSDRCKYFFNSSYRGGASAF